MLGQRCFVISQEQDGGQLKGLHIVDIVFFGGALKKALLDAGYQGPGMMEVYRQDYADEQELLECYRQVEAFFTAPLDDTF